jgi:DNA polymerase-3 subunit epsilon
MKAAGRKGPKSPKLSEAYRHFLGEDLIGAHDALVDVRACRRIYDHLKMIGGAV